MGSVRTADAQRRIFLAAFPAILVMVLAGFVLLDDSFPLDARQTVTSVGFLLAGLTAVASCAYRAAQTAGRRRQSWLLFTVAGSAAILSNVYAAATSASFESNAVADVGLMLAVVLAIVGLIRFPSARRRGTDQVLMSLDGLVAGGGVLAITSVLVYPELIDAGTAGMTQQTIALAIPVVDTVLITVALVLLLRASGPDRVVLLLIAFGFLVYAANDLAYAVIVAHEGAFTFGTRMDLGWIAGYFVVSLAALYPSQIVDEPPPRALHHADTRGAVIVFAVILAAGVVQVLFGERLHGATALLWLVMVLAAGARQGILSLDNASLRAGLERRVREQTADLERLARQNEVLLTSVGDGIYGVDRAGRITFVNPSAAQALGRPTEDVLGLTAHAAFHADHDHDDCYISRAVSSGNIVAGVEDTYGRSGGRAFPVEVTAAPVLDPDDGSPQGAVVVFRDVTQRREVDRMKNEFLSVVSHELRTPLTSIRGALGLLAGGALGRLEPRASSMVGVAVESSERLTRLIDDLLDIERIGSGARAMRTTAHDAHDLVADAVQQIEGMAAPQGVRVEIGPCEGRVLGDQDQVMQTLTNLLGNAIKFSERGGCVVASAVREGGHVRFEVKDDGRGIPASKLEEVFVPFAQVDSSDARQKGGTGLGLAISRSIVERHGGRIWAESEYGEGTSVFFTLPVAPVATQQVREAS